MRRARLHKIELLKLGDALDGKVTVYYWPDGGKAKEGHIALRTYSGGIDGKGIYASFWPKIRLITLTSIDDVPENLAPYNFVLISKAYQLYYMAPSNKLEKVAISTVAGLAQLLENFSEQDSNWRRKVKGCLARWLTSQRSGVRAKLISLMGRWSEAYLGFGGVNHSLAEDKLYCGRKKAEKFHLYSLDVRRINKEFELFRASDCDWGLLGAVKFFQGNKELDTNIQACSGLVFDLLFVGGFANYCPELLHALNIINFDHDAYRKHMQENENKVSNEVLAQERDFREVCGFSPGYFAYLEEHSRKDNTPLDVSSLSSNDIRQLETEGRKLYLDYQNRMNSITQEQNQELFRRQINRQLSGPNFREQVRDGLKQEAKHLAVVLIFFGVQLAYEGVKYLTRKPVQFSPKLVADKIKFAVAIQSKLYDIKAPGEFDRNSIFSGKLNYNSRISRSLNQEKKKLQEALIVACRSADLQTVVNLICEGADPNFYSKALLHPLEAACWSLDIELVSYLLEKSNENSHKIAHKLAHKLKSSVKEFLTQYDEWLGGKSYEDVVRNAPDGYEFGELFFLANVGIGKMHGTAYEFVDQDRFHARFRRFRKRTTRGALLFWNQYPWQYDYAFENRQYSSSGENNERVVQTLRLWLDRQVDNRRNEIIEKLASAGKEVEVNIEDTPNQESECCLS